jgi:hypothetical protein
MDEIIDRILRQTGDKELINKIVSLSKSDLNSLLLKVFQIHAINTKPTDLLKAFELNRFSIPSEIDPVKYHKLEAEILSLAQKLKFITVLLSPSAPLASCSAFGCVDQNNIVSATRGSEILSDPTNMLSVIIASKLKNNELDSKIPLHFCTTARVTRAALFPNTKRHFAHFGLFCMVSSGKDAGSYNCEKNLFVEQINLIKKLLIEKYNAKLAITLKKRGGYKNNDIFFNTISDLLENMFPDVSFSYDLEHEGNNYYKGINYKIYMDKDNEMIEIGDGGFVDWIQKMKNNKKERCLISAIGLDRLLL